MLIKDIRFAVRSLLRTPGFSVVAIVVLALGIGANTAVFSLVNAALIRPSPAERGATQVVGLYSRDRAHPGTYRDFSYPDYQDIRSRNPVFSDLAGMTLALVGYKDADQTRRVFTAIVTANYFATFAGHLEVGRDFSLDEEKPGAGIPVVVVSYEHWKAHGFDPHIVGTPVRLNSRPFTVVGVAPQGFTAAASIISPEFWLPTGTYEMVVNDMFRTAEHPLLGDRLNHSLMLFGRLKPGVDVAKTESLLAGLSTELQREYPAENKNQVLLAHALTRFGVSSNPQDDSQTASLSILLMAMTAIVLAIACLNLANMLLARGTSRRKEIAIRLALGSGRGPIVRQLLVEGFLLSLAGGAGGLLIAFWATRLLVASMAPAMQGMFALALDPAPDLRVLLATLGFSALSTLVFGLGPAWKLSRTDVVPELKEQGGETGRRRWRRISLRNALVVGQVALSLGLLTAAGLFIRAAGKAASAEPGFSLAQSIVANVDPSMAGYDEAKGRELYRHLLERMRALPGVEAASLASVVPFGDMTMGRRVEKVGTEGNQAPAGPDDASFTMGNGAPPRDRGNAIGVNYYIVGAGYFETLGIRILRGRGFNADEELRATAAPRVVIDETLARRLFPKADPLGQFIRIVDSDARGTSPGTQAAPLEIIGIARPIRHSLLQEDVQPQVYVAFGQHYQANMFVHLRVRQPGGEPAVLRLVRQDLRLLDDRLPVLSLRTMAAHRDASMSLWMVKTGANLFSAIGLAAVFLALVGVYGVKAYLVSRRTREIGIRMSLGATPRDVLWLVLREGLVLTAAGIGVGLVLAVAVGQGVRSLLYQVSALDPLTFVVAPLLLAAAMLLACYFPARRAMKVAPLRALRSE
jgi:predicted permease